MLQQIFTKKARPHKNDDRFENNEEINYNLDEINVDLDCSSRLSMNLNEILNDRSCLSYFIQYLELKEALSLIKFFLDVDCFKKASERDFPLLECESDKSSEYLCNLKSESVMNNNIKNDNELKLVKTHDIECERVPELKTLCDLSMRKSLTDDEKSLISAAEINKQNKQIDTSEILNNNESNFERELIQSKRKSILNDAIGIYKKYLTQTSQYYIDFPPTISSKISLDLCSQDDNEKFPNSNFYLDAQKYAFDRLETEYLNEFLESAFYRKYCIDVLENCTISDILHSDNNLLSYFMEILEQEKQTNLLEFWLAGMNFRINYTKQQNNQLINSNIFMECQSDAMILYEKYFSLQAKNPLRIQDKIRSHIELEICGNSIIVVSKCFDIPLKIVKKHLEIRYFPFFLKSQLFLNHLKDLILKTADYVEYNQNKTLRKHRKTHSDASYETTKDLKHSFISQQNTLLAMDGTKFNKKSSTDMHIDSRQLTNPDLLWQRNSKNGLVFGRVNSLGRYERDFEELDESVNKNRKWSFNSTKLKNTVKKLVSVSEHKKEQEEIAWQLAEMIVNDVTSITLAKKSNN